MTSMTPRDTFKQIIELTEKTTALMEAFGELDLKEREAILTESFQKEAGAVKAKDEISIRLIRTAEMLIGASTPKVAALLGGALDHENLDVRMLAGDVLMHIAEEGLDNIYAREMALYNRLRDGFAKIPGLLHHCPPRPQSVRQVG